MSMQARLLLITLLLISSVLIGYAGTVNETVPQGAIARVSLDGPALLLEVSELLELFENFYVEQVDGTYLLFDGASHDIAAALPLTLEYLEVQGFGDDGELYYLVLSTHKPDGNSFVLARPLTEEGGYLFMAH
jgi:hypothetical protein